MAEFRMKFFVARFRLCGLVIETQFGRNAEIVEDAEADAQRWRNLP